MPSCKSLLFGVIAVIVAIGVYKSHKCCQSVKAPQLDLSFNWGDGTKSDTDIKPFKVNFGQDVIEELRKELARPRFLPPPLKDVGFTYGFNSEMAEKVIKYWRDSYLTKWNERQDYLNSFPQFTVRVQGLNLHYIHIKADPKSGKTIVPLILMHGWPGSVREFYELIPKLKQLSKDKPYAFDIVVPSLPGYGWSEGTKKPGLSATEMAVVMRNLMLKLGYKNFVVQGGDWGSLIGAALSALFPENVIGYHSNMCGHPMSSFTAFMKGVIVSLVPSYFMDPEYADFHFPMGEKFSFLMEESGYMHLQATKPDTIGTALLNNPVGLAVYILEKFSTWTKPEYKLRADGGLTESFTLDALLDNIMIYYLSNSITTSQRLYAETFAKKHMSLKVDHLPIAAPTGCDRYKNDLAHSLDWQLKSRFTNLIHSTYNKNGGHFAAFELPEIFFKNFIDYMDKLWIEVNRPKSKEL